MMLLIFSEPVYHWISVRSPRDFSADRKKLDSLAALWGQETRDIQDSDSPRMVLFHFDPNSATSAELQTLGFSKGLSTRIASYRSKGGRFRVKSDLLKIYGMDSSFYQQLYGYIQLPEKLVYQDTKRFEPRLPVQYRRVVEKFDLNKADTSQLIKIYGIGEKLAVRIVRYREKLGGFIRPEQVREVYGLDSLVVQQVLSASFIDSNFKPILLNINTASEKDLSSHPYISKTMAKAIVAYRFQHRKFHDPQEIREIHIIRNEEANRIIPYLEIRE